METSTKGDQAYHPQNAAEILEGRDFRAVHEDASPLCKEGNQFRRAAVEHAQFRGLPGNAVSERHVKDDIDACKPCPI